MSPQVTVLVTVGTTRHDALVNAVTDAAFLVRARANGINVASVILQHGQSKLGTAIDSRVEGHVFIPELDELIHTMAQQATAESPLVIFGHCGSGTVLDVLRGPIGSTANAHMPHVRLVLVPNDTLMGGHQDELAEALSNLGVVSVVRCNALSKLSLAERLADSMNDVSAVCPLPPPSDALSLVIADILAQ